MAEHLRAHPACDAITRAARKVDLAGGAIVHCDRGGQYTSGQLTNHLKEYGITSSMGRTGVCWDNAMAEFSFAALKNELVYRTVLPTRAKARTAIAEYIEVFYNRQLIHSGLGHRTPLEVANEYQQDPLKRSIEQSKSCPMRAHQTTQPETGSDVTPDATTRALAPTTTLVHAAGAPGGEWWRHAVIYQVYPRSFADGSGDGIGDLPGITARLNHLARLGVDAIWLSPFYRSPQADAGYDVADYRDVDPLFGTLADFDALLERAHGLGLRVIVDLVPNHTSDEHVWFQAALAAGPGSPERARYLFRPGKGADGAEPPNNWNSIFGGPAWTRLPDGEWYLHLFDTRQPDLDWENPEVRAEFEDVLRFWLDKGVDGFRIDVAHGMVKAAGLPDWDGEIPMIEGAETAPEDGSIGAVHRGPMFDQEGVHEIYRAWNRVLAAYDGDRALVAVVGGEHPVPGAVDLVDALLVEHGTPVY